MSLFKSAQFFVEEPSEEVQLEPGEIVVFDEKPSPQEVVELTPNHPETQDEPKIVELSFKLPHLPGSDLKESDLEVDLVDPKDVKDDTKNVKDKWNWNDHGHDGFLNWAHQMFKCIPKHSGKSVGGIERAIAYLKKLSSEISKAMQSDFDGKIDADKVQEAYQEITDGIERLTEALNKMTKSDRKKLADQQNSLVKEGQKTTAVGGIMITVPLLISSIARACVNSMVSNGRDLEDMVKRAINLYKLSNREQAELYQLLSDMNVYIRRDRLHDFSKPFDPQSSDNAELGPNYQS